jgi:hypothetical protein
MNYRLLLIITILAFYYANTHAQTVRACMDTSASNASSINIWLRADITTPQDTCASSLQFSIAIPDTFTGLLPTTFTVDSSAWLGSAWTVAPAYQEAGFWHYDILTAYTPCMTYTANLDYFAMRVTPIGGTASPYDCYLLCLPDGGATTGSALFYHFGEWKSDGSSLYFARPGTVANNQLSYDLVGGSPGIAASWSKLDSTASPLTLLGMQLTAVWNGNNAALNLVVAGQQDEVLNYSMQRSTNGKDKFETIVAITNTLQANYASEDVDAAKASNTHYYRIAANTKYGKVLYSNVAVLTRNKGEQIFVYPSPVQDVVYIELADGTVLAELLTCTGQTIYKESTTGSLHKFNMANLANGIYLIRVSNNDGSFVTHKIVKR